MLNTSIGGDTVATICSAGADIVSGHSHASRLKAVLDVIVLFCPLSGVLVYKLQMHQMQHMATVLTLWINLLVIAPCSTPRNAKGGFATSIELKHAAAADSFFSRTSPSQAFAHAQQYNRIVINMAHIRCIPHVQQAHRTINFPCLC